MTTIAKATTKGQITLPISWRKKFDTNDFIIEVKSDSLSIRPLDLKKIKSEEEYTVFDAIRDNKGRGIKAKDLIKVLAKLNG